MITRRKTSEDYRKELKDLEKQMKALEVRIVKRTKELCERYPDVQIGYKLSESGANVPVFSDAYINANMNYDTALVVMMMIEKELANRHPHKQTKIEFPETQHEKLMQIVKNIHALNIPKSKDK